MPAPLVAPVLRTCIGQMHRREARASPLIHCQRRLTWVLQEADGALNIRKAHRSTEVAIGKETGRVGWTTSRRVRQTATQNGARSRTCTEQTGFEEEKHPADPL